MLNNKNQQQEGGIAGPLGFLALIILWYIAKAIWPWSLLAVPILLLIFIGFDEDARASFGRTDQRPVLKKYRQGMGGTFLVFAGIVSFLCLEYLEGNSLCWWLVPLALLAMALRLFSLLPAETVRSRIAIATVRGINELVIVSIVVLVLYGVMAVWLDSLTLEKATKESLQSWEANVRKAHRIAEDWKPSELFMLLVLVGTILLRALAARGKAVPLISDKQLVLAAKAGKGLAVLSTAIAVAANLTFLATSSSGMWNKISVQLSSLEEKYNDLQSVLNDKVDVSMRQVLLSKALRTMPTDMRKTMGQSVRFDRERNDLERARKMVEASWGATNATEQNPDSFPSSLDLKNETRHASDDVEDHEAAPDWTTETLNVAKINSEYVFKDETAATLNDREDPMSAVVNLNVANVPLFELLFTRAPVIHLLADHYPVVGELISAISEVVSESVYKVIKSKIVRRIKEICRRNREQPTDALIRKEVKEELSSVPVDISTIDVQAIKNDEVKIENYRKEVSATRQALNISALQHQHEAFENEMARLDEQISMMKMLKIEGLDKTLATTTELLLAYKKALEGMEPGWPAIGAPSDEQVRAMTDLHGRFAILPATWRLNNQYASDLRSQFPSTSIVTPVIKFDNDPIRTASWLNGYCQDRLTELILQTPVDSTQATNLKITMGHSYENYRVAHERHVAEQASQYPPQHPPRPPIQNPGDSQDYEPHPVEIR